MSTTRFQCDYAKRAANCKKCKMQLAKGVLRIAKIVPNYFVQNTDGPPPDMKQYHHPQCLFDTFYKARATTKVIESSDDIEGWDDLEDGDKEELSKLIDDLTKHRGSKTATPAKTKATPAKKRKSNDDDEEENEEDEPMDDKKKQKQPEETPKKRSKKMDDAESSNAKASKTKEINETSSANLFIKFCKMCDVIASVSKYTEKTKAVNLYITRDKYDGDVLTLLKLLLPGIDQRVYNVKEKQLIKHFSVIFDLNADEMMDAFKTDGDLSKVIRETIEKKNLTKVSKSDWSIQKVDRFLEKLTEFTRDDEQIAHLKFAAKRLSPLEIQYLVRLLMKDLRMNAGVKHVLDALHEDCYEAFQNCRNLEEIVRRYKEGKLGKTNAMFVGINIGTPVLPMLAEACKSVKQAMDRCSNGMFAEIKYDGERVQIHKQGKSYKFFSRSLKPVMDYKVAHCEEFIPKAFPNGTDLILDAEVLLVDTTTGKPLPFGTLGVHKKAQFKDASVCLFIFDLLRYNDDDLMNKPLHERKKKLEDIIKPVENRVHMSNYQIIGHGNNNLLKTMILKAIDEGLEGLVLKDRMSIYEPGKRHWLKVKKDYLEEGKMADTADLLVLGAYFGTGSKGGIMSVFLMGVYDESAKCYKTVTKCGNGHTDDALDKINKQLKSQMKRIDRDFDCVPKWLRCSRQLVPDFVLDDPQKAIVWEITGAEFSKSDNHSANGISIRFPRVTRIRDDKDWTSATSLKELQRLFEKSKEKSDISTNVDEVDSTPLYSKEGMSHDSEDVMAVVHTSDDQLGSSKKAKKDSEKKEKKEESKKKKQKEESDSDDADENDEDKDACPPGKTPCKYGKDCYRKNPEHKKEFWHPAK